MTPFSIDSRIPRSTAGMYSRGMAPPLISFANWKPPPGGTGSRMSETSANCPRPPIGLEDPALHRRDVLPGNGPALDIVRELEAPSRRHRLEDERDVGELPAASGLLREPGPLLHAFRDRF